MTQLLQNAAYGTALILAAAVLRRVLKERLVPGARLALWAVCLFRLLTPAAPESVLSLWGLGRWFGWEAQSAPAAHPNAPASNAVGTFVAVSPEMNAPAVPTPQPAIPWETVLMAAWLAVGGLLAVRYVLSYVRTRRTVKSAILLGRDDPRYTPLPKCARLREGPMEGAPLTFGAVRPTVVLSPGLDGTELECVLAHEGVHARRRDNLWHYAMSLALVAHWWNPAVWLMARLLRRDIELSCDRAALKRLGGDRRADYANALVSLATVAEGPAFCQTFGRKAAEERILSIMKFKKTSIIGVVLSLTLVAGVTVAFASNPSTPDDTVVFHGRTYNRADLSQETLDWLDWYLSLPEEGQMAVSFEPPELWDGEIPTAQDAYDSVHVNSDVPVYDPDWQGATFRDCEPVNPDDVDLGLMKERLDQMVADGEVTQDKADARLASMEELLEQVRQNENMTLYWDEDDMIGWVRYSGRIDLGTAHVSNDGGYALVPESASIDVPISLDDYTPLVDFGIGTMGKEFYDYNFVYPDPSAVAGGVIGGGDSATGNPMPMRLDEYQALLEGLVSTGKMSQEDYDWFLDGATEGMKGQSTPYLWATEDGSYAIKGGLICTRADCGNNSRHIHDGEWYTGWTNKSALPPYCADENCTVSGLHWHENGEVIYVYETMPAKISVCPVEGCTIWGTHTHDGTTYLCNGGHCGGVCDGRCNDYEDDAVATPSATPVSSGHHSESHHTDSHH